LQVPLPLHTPEQQRALLPHGAPDAAHWQVPFAQLPEQQSAPPAHAPAAATHAHVPPVQLPEQQSPAVVQATPADEHAHVPLLHVPEQQNAPALQTALVPAHEHTPPSQSPVQHSAAALQAAPRAVHAQPVEAPEYTPEQQMDGSGRGAKGPWVYEPVGPQQAPDPPQTRPGSHCPLSVHAWPFEGLHSTLHSASVKTEPEQHWFADVG
jgi:hypothetical protein